MIGFSRHFSAISQKAPRSIWSIWSMVSNYSNLLDFWVLGSSTIAMFLCLLHQKKWKVLQQPRNPAVKVGLHRLRYIGFFVPLKHCLARRNSPISGWKLQAFNAGWDGLWLGSVLVMSYECCFFLSLVWGVSPKQQVWWTSENSKMILKPLVSGELCFCRSYGEYIKVTTQKCIWRMHLQFVARSKLIW